MENQTFNNAIKPELLVPAGDFECIRAGVQNGANCVYFGANSFSARASAKNFSVDELNDVVKYCKLRNVKTNLTLNTLITDSEFGTAAELAKKAYLAGVDAIIVQDLGLAKYLIKLFPKMEIHASTQMSVHNLEGVLELERLGFSRVVLSREVSLNEIEYIRNNCTVDLEVFVHGALCISYSGQCLFSSLVGGRSGNRGKCAQPCRLPYELLECSNNHEKSMGKGYLLSPKDLSSLELLPKLISLGINSFKIEGRMKTPEYVATVTKIYRKYIDLALSGAPYSIDDNDKHALLQVFNRGGFSTGHLLPDANRNLIYPIKPNNIGLYLGNVSIYNGTHGHIRIKLNENINIGDCISIDGESGKYTVSEIIAGNNSLKSANIGQTVKLGRMKGNIKPGAKVYKISSKQLSLDAEKTFSPNCENKKIPLSAKLLVKENQPIKLTIAANMPPFYNNIIVEETSDIIPCKAISSPITEQRLKEQICKLGNTPYVFKEIKIVLDEGLHIPSISALNNLRRSAISKLEETTITTSLKERQPSTTVEADVPRKLAPPSSKKISLLLENMNLQYDYSKIEGIDNIYIPLKFLANSKYQSSILELSKKFNLYLYMPTIIKPNYKNLFLNSIDNIMNIFNVKGFVISNISGVTLLSKYMNSDYTFVANYTMNVFNKYSIYELKNIGINAVTPSVELDKSTLQNLCLNSSIPTEVIAYGRIILMNSSYCLLGKSNKCYPDCSMQCSGSSSYFLKDRLGFRFRVVPDNIQTVTSIYNSKITSIDTFDIPAFSLRINVLDEDVPRINEIVKSVRAGKKMEGAEFTNGNLNRTI